MVYEVYSWKEKKAVVKCAWKITSKERRLNGKERGIRRLLRILSARALPSRFRL